MATRVICNKHPAIYVTYPNGSECPLCTSYQSECELAGKVKTLEIRVAKLQYLLCDIAERIEPELLDPVSEELIAAIESRWEDFLRFGQSRMLGGKG